MLLKRASRPAQHRAVNCHQFGKGEDEVLIREAKRNAYAGIGRAVSLAE